jgi:hypothetical protein
MTVIERLFRLCHSVKDITRMSEDLSAVIW